MTPPPAGNGRGNAGVATTIRRYGAMGKWRIDFSVLVFAACSSRPSASLSTRSAGRLADPVLIAVGGSALLIAIVLWFDNAQGGLTGNGVFKSLEIKPWVVHPDNAPLVAANYLYYPLMGALCRGLHMLGVLVGGRRRQLTIINAVTGGLGRGR